MRSTVEIRGASWMEKVLFTHSLICLSSLRYSTNLPGGTTKHQAPFQVPSSGQTKSLSEEVPSWCRTEVPSK